MTDRIITVRHGRPNLSREALLKWSEYGNWWAAYDRVGLHPGQVPPPQLVEMAKGSPTVISSTLPRARETAAQILGEARKAPADPLYVEAPLPPPPAPLLRLRPGVWGVISRIYWFCGYAPGVEGHRAAWDRVFTAAGRVSTLALSGQVMLCAHGYFNWMLDKALRLRGWRRVYDGGNHYWAWRIYERPIHRREPVPAGQPAE